MYEVEFVTNPTRRVAKRARVAYVTHRPTIAVELGGGTVESPSQSFRVIRGREWRPDEGALDILTAEIAEDAEMNKVIIFPITSAISARSAVNHGRRDGCKRTAHL